MNGHSALHLTRSCVEDTPRGECRERRTRCRRWAGGRRCQRDRGTQGTDPHGVDPSHAELVARAVRQAGHCCAGRAGHPICDCRPRSAHRALLHRVVRDRQRVVEPRCHPRQRDRAIAHDTVERPRYAGHRRPMRRRQEEELVRVASVGAGQRVGGGRRVERRPHLCRRREVRALQQPSHRAGHVWRCHRRATERERGCVTCVPGGQDVRARGEQVIARSIVRVRGDTIVDLRCAHGDRRGNAGRARVARVRRCIPSSDHDGHPIGNDGVHCRIQRVRSLTADAHVGDRRYAGRVVVDDPVEPGDHCRCRGAATACEDLDGDQRNTFGHAVCGATDGAGDMRAVTVAVLDAVPVADDVHSAQDPAGKLAVGAADPGVDDVSGHAAAGRVI